jgi:hypothetical protein
MKIIRPAAIGLILFISVIASAASSKQAFTGAWDWTVSPQSMTFSVVLRQHGKEISGQYCAVAQNGNRVDCDDEGNTNIHGTVDATAKSAVVDFSSFFGAERGRALLKIDNHGRLIWKVINSPIGGDFYAPKDAVLDRNIGR